MTDASKAGSTTGGAEEGAGVEVISLDSSSVGIRVEIAETTNMADSKDTRGRITMNFAHLLVAEEDDRISLHRTTTIDAREEKITTAATMDTEMSTILHREGAMEEEVGVVVEGVVTMTTTREEEGEIMMTGAPPRLLVAEGVVTMITTDVEEGEVATMVVVVVDFAEEAEVEVPLVISTMTTMAIEEEGETVVEEEIVTETTTSTSEEEGEGEEAGVVAAEITITTTTTTDLRDRAREVDLEWDVVGEGEEEAYMAVVGVAVDGHTKEEEVEEDMIIVVTMVVPEGEVEEEE